MNKNSKNQKEELARRLALQDEEKGNNIKANAFYFNFNAPQARYYKVRTRIASR